MFGRSDEPLAAPLWATLSNAEPPTGTDSMAETTPPSESTPEPEPLPPGVSSHTILNGNPSLRSMAPGGVTHTSDPPLPLQTFPVTSSSGAAFEIQGTGGEAPDIARFVGHVTSRTVIIRAVLNNPVAVRLTALSLLGEIDLKIETLRAGGSNSEITALDDLKRRVEEFLAANEKGEETAIADTTLSIADGLRRYWTEEYGKICDTGLLGVGLSFCAVAGAIGVSDTTMLAVTALAGGKRVVDVMKAAADLVWGKGDKS
jgi:hypothetical protein